MWRAIGKGRIPCHEDVTGDIPGWCQADVYKDGSLSSRMSPTSAEVSIVADHQCPDGWTQLDDRCFIFKNMEKTFTEAETICINVGGNLVSIHSELENEVVKQLIKAANANFVDAWIGLHDAVREGDMMWTDGFNKDYEDFGSGEPSGADCVKIKSSDKQWHDTSCTEENAFVCCKKVD
uniref:galactose-specific lectin nattectin-like n=1 Tax=Doryrhamphus excisus TaxID=161450 RepID=UPI0025AEAA29|nr:galactose-specific lectin nattectin-like [Doryrhamphus excisus]